jgi:DNA-binding response OmpR family regulator
VRFQGTTPMIQAQAINELDIAAFSTAALALAITHRPRFVITATGLRFIDGYTLCSLLRAEPLTADVPIVMLTCDTTPATVTLARSSGADRVVGTPYSPGTLLQAVWLGRDRAWTAGDSAQSIPSGSPAVAALSVSSCPCCAEHFPERSCSKVRCPLRAR